MGILSDLSISEVFKTLIFVILRLHNNRSIQNINHCHTERKRSNSKSKNTNRDISLNAQYDKKKHSVVASNHSIAVIASKTQDLRGDFMGMYILRYVFDCWVCRLSVIMTYYYLA
ncbi:hypothetical protein [Helicobacter sp. T3_23-1059]